MNRPGSDRTRTCQFPLRNTGQVRPFTNGHPEDVSSYVDSDVYRLSASVSGYGWSVQVDAGSRGTGARTVEEVDGLLSSVSSGSRELNGRGESHELDGCGRDGNPHVPVCWRIQDRCAAMPVYSVVVAHSPLLSPGPLASPTRVQFARVPVIAGPPESPWQAD